MVADKQRGPGLAALWIRLHAAAGAALVALTAACLARGAGAIENKCGACITVQHELVDILLAERPQFNLDMRNRLNSQGKREGKVIDYRMSELRVIQILEGLCEKVKKYSLKIVDKQKKRIWMHGQTHATDRLRLIAEEQGKELKRWCDRMLEEYEDDMAQLIRDQLKKAYTELPILLCRNITGNCKSEDAYLAETKRMASHWPTTENAGSVPGPPITVKTTTEKPVKEDGDQENSSGENVTLESATSLESDSTQSDSDAAAGGKDEL